MTMPLPPIPPLPPTEQQGAGAPQLPQVPLPSALQALSGLFMLAQSMPQMLPQASQQLEQRRGAAGEREIAQFQLQRQVEQDEAAKQERAAEAQQRRFDQQMQQLAASDARENALAAREHDAKMLDLQERAFSLQKQQSALEKTQFDATAARLLGTMYSEALDRVDATVLDPKARAAILADPQTMMQYQLQRAKDPKGADTWLAQLSGGQLTQTERQKRAIELVLNNPGATQLFSATGLKPEDVFNAEFMPVDLPLEGPQAEALNTLSQVSLRRMMVGSVTPVEEANFATAMRNLGGTEAINKISDDLARLAEVKYGVDRDQFEQNLAQLIDTAAGPEAVALSVPSAPPTESRIKRLFGRDRESEIEDLRRKLKFPLMPAKRKAEMRARLKELGANEDWEAR